MSNISDQMEEIKALISSDSETDRSFGYSTLLHFQEQSSDSPPSIQALIQSSRSLINLIVSDIHHEDEEVASQALKCLGFMIYHPSLIATIPAEDGRLVLESLAKLISVTKMKSVCNLGVWCISMQQFDTPLVAACFDTLLPAVVHALDNPSGSLSTTFEALQAVAKLTAQMSEVMRESSHLWAPPIYRRLLSIDKRERDMSERCLLKIRSTILPAPTSLSKEKSADGDEGLFRQGYEGSSCPGMGVVYQLPRIWCFEEQTSSKYMLKVLEQTFSDHNPQVQIASLVAWQGLIDALVHPQILSCKKNASSQLQTSSGKNSELTLNGFSKSLKLTMTPLIGIISSKCDVSVLRPPLNTWCYLLHKLDTSINSPSVIKLALDPMFQAIFKMGPDSKKYVSFMKKVSEDTSSEEERKLEQVIEIWKSLYGSVCVAYFKLFATNTLGCDLCAMLNSYFDENRSIFEYNSELGLCNKDLEFACISFSGNVLVCILEQKLTSDTGESGKECSVCIESSGLINIFEFASRVMKFFYINMAKEPASGVVNSRVFSALTLFISRLHSKQDILSFFEIVSGPLLQWLSHQDIKDENVKDKLGILWAEILNRLRRSQPLLTFDSSFLKLQASLLEKTLDHWNTFISDETIIFWNSTFGKQVNLEYPQNLLHVLHKLSRNGRISLYNRSKSFVARCSTLETATATKCCKITSTQNRSSKRVELTEEGMDLTKGLAAIEFKTKKSGTDRASKGSKTSTTRKGEGLQWTWSWGPNLYKSRLFAGKRGVARQSGYPRFRSHVGDVEKSWITVFYACNLPLPAKSFDVVR
ncbi:hypothetical protein GQ457_08G002810 [Hibiscus cannabinus]